MSETLTVYETKNSLLLKTNEVAYRIRVRSDFPMKISTEQAKTKTSYSIKFVVHNGLLYVRYGKEQGVEGGLFQTLGPDFPGVLAPYFTRENLPYVHAFLNRHFPDAKIKPLTMEEKWIHDELKTKKNDRRLHNKIKLDKHYREVSELIAKIATMCFPIYIDFVDNRLSDGFYHDRPPLPYKCRVASRAKTFKEMVVTLFGTYRKDLAKAVIGSHIDRIAWASCFAEVLDIDAIIEGLKDKESTYAQLPADMSVLEGYPRSAIKQLYMEGLVWNEGMSYIEDALEMAAMVPMEERKKCTSWDNLHDTGIANYYYAVEGNTKVKYSRDFDGFLAQATIQDFNIAPLDTAQSFIETGKVMDVCVGSKHYIGRAFSGEGYCFRLDNKEDKPYALFEIKRNRMSGDWNISQARTYRNGEVEESLYEEVKTELGKYITLGRNHGA